MEITVLYNRVSELLSGSPEEILADEDTIMTAREVAAALVVLGYGVDMFEVNKKTLTSLSKHRTERFGENPKAIHRFRFKNFAVHH